MKYKIDDTLFSVINAIPNPVIIISADKLKSVNNAFLEFFDIKSIKEFTNKYGSLSHLFIKEKGCFSPSNLKTNENWTDYLILNPNVSRMVSMKNLKNDLITFELTLKKIENKSEYIIVFNDITVHVFEKNEYLYFAYHDYLTKIYNRQKFDELFFKEFENKKRYKDHLSILLIDIDHFKIVNDDYGHLVGDLTLVALSGLISKSLRTNDIFARWGGEEFMILLPRTDIDAAYVKAEGLRAMIKSMSVKGLPPITISIGLTEMNDTDTINVCLERVDKALYLAKKKRNDVVKVI